MIFAAAPVAMAILRGPDAVFELVNAKWSGLVSKRSYLGLSWRQAYPELDTSPLLNRLAHVFATGEEFVAQEMELRVTSPEGQIEDRYYTFTYTRIDDAAGEPYGIYCVTVDVTDTVRYRMRLEESEKSLKAAVTARDLFLGIAAHELKTPLTSWMLQAQLQQRKFERDGAAAFTPEQILQSLRGSVAQVGRLSRLVNDMLDASQISMGRMVMNFATVDLADLVRHTVLGLQDSLEQVGCKLYLDVTPCRLARADAFRVEQVIINLLTNAIKYAPHRPVEVSLMSKSPCAELTVRDHGAGIPEALQSRLFQRFERLVSASEVSGLGLGLHISREIIEAHGGHIRLVSRAGEGAAFIVTLPLE